MSSPPALICHPELAAKRKRTQHKLTSVSLALAGWTLPALSWHSRRSSYSPGSGPNEEGAPLSRAPCARAIAKMKHTLRRFYASTQTKKSPLHWHLAWLPLALAVGSTPGQHQSTSAAPSTWPPPWQVGGKDHSGTDAESERLKVGHNVLGEVLTGRLTSTK